MKINVKLHLLSKFVHFVYYSEQKSEILFSMINLSSIIYEHKEEKEQILRKKFVPRIQLDKFKELIGTDLIKVITGPRRAGKSVFTFLSLQDKNFAYINFDDEEIINSKSDQLLKSIFEVYGETKILFFDEIQNFDNWELFINKLHRRGFNVVITGSNSKLLSKELASSLTGRYIAHQILPFNFYEVLQAKNYEFKNLQFITPENKGRLLNLLNEYLKAGGYPEIVTKDIDFKNYLETLTEAVLFKDIVKRYNIRYPQSLYNLYLNLLNSFTKEVSFQSLMKNSNLNSVSSVQKYVSYLEDAYMITLLNRFSFKVKEQIKAPKKVYTYDNGMITVKSFRFMENPGRMLENLVFIELVKLGFIPNHHIFYYKSPYQREVDFIIKENLKVTSAIQVAYELNTSEVINREVKGLVDASKELNCENLFILTWDTESEEEFNGKKIIISPVWKFLLQNNPQTKNLF